MEIKLKPQEIKINIDSEKLAPTLEDLEITPSSVEQNFNHPNSYGYDKVKVNAISTDILNVTPSKQTQQFSGIYGSVNVSAVDNTIDNNIQASNIKNGVTILGVTGNMDSIENYLKTTISSSTSSSNNALSNLLKKTTKFLITSGCTGLANAFERFPSNITFDSNSNTSNVTSFYYAFSYYGGTSIDLSGLNANKVTTIGNMFQYASKLTSVNFGASFGTNRITTMSYMFSNCSSITSLNLNALKANAATNINGMFQSCSKLTNVDMSEWTNSISYAGSTFSGCTQLASIDVRNINWANCNSYSNMLNNVPTSCLIIVKNATQKAWFNSHFASYTNVKTPSEL